VEATEDTDLYSFTAAALAADPEIDYVICDEAQFLSAHQVEQLAEIVDELGVDVFAFGIATDFRTRLFPGSQRLIELADEIRVMQVETLCWCGARATHNARTVGGEMVVEGEQVVVGDVTPDREVAYTVLCRRHHRARQAQGVPTPAVASA
jgi:thymidine kinase